MSNRTQYLKQPADGTKIDAAGGLYVSAEVLARFGEGDAAVGRKELRALLAADKASPAHSGPVNDPPASVRIAGPRDEEEILKLLVLDLETHAAKIAPVDQEKVLEYIRCGTRQRGGFTCVIGRPIVAVMILVPTQWWWSQGWFWQEQVAFVHPDHRNSRYASDLLDYAKWVSTSFTRKTGTPWRLLAGIMANWRMHGKIAFYRRKVWQTGALFLYPPAPNGEHL